MRRVGRSTYRLVYWVPFLVLFSISFVLGQVINEQAAVPLGMLAVTWLVVGRWIARWLVPLFVSKIACPGCGDVFDAVNIWDCACGFHDHRARHLLSMRCPKCDATSSHMNCPRCSATILLW